MVAVASSGKFLISSSYVDSSDVVTVAAGLVATAAGTAAVESLLTTAIQVTFGRCFRIRLVFGY